MPAARGSNIVDATVAVCGPANQDAMMPSRDNHVRSQGNVLRNYGLGKAIGRKHRPKIAVVWKTTITMCGIHPEAITCKPPIDCVDVHSATAYTRAKVFTEDAVGLGHTPGVSLWSTVHAWTPIQYI